MIILSQFHRLAKMILQFFPRVPFAGKESWLRKSGFFATLCCSIIKKRERVWCVCVCSWNSRELSKQQSYRAAKKKFWSSQGKGLGSSLGKQSLVALELCSTTLQSSSQRCRPALSRHWPVGNSVQIFPDDCWRACATLDSWCTRRFRHPLNEEMAKNQLWFKS